MVIESTSPYSDNNGNIETKRVLVDILKREVVAREAGRERVWLYDEEGGSHLVNMSLEAFHVAYEEALAKDNMGI
jgi:hypothetical protein